MESFIRPVQMSCNHCGTAGVRPRIVRNETRTEIVEEARYVCPRCSAFFYRGTVSRVLKEQTNEANS